MLKKQVIRKIAIVEGREVGKGGGYTGVGGQLNAVVTCTCATKDLNPVNPVHYTKLGLCVSVHHEN